MDSEAEKARFDMVCDSDLLSHARTLSALRVAHIGNIANNAYLNAKFLRRVGISAFALNVDYRHVMAQPEWEDADIKGEVDELNPDWTSVDLRGFERPSWFIDLKLKKLDVCGRPLAGPSRLRYLMEEKKLGAAQALERAGMHRNPGQGWVLPRTNRGRLKAASILPAAALLYSLGNLNRAWEQSRASIGRWSLSQREFVEKLVAEGEICPKDLRWAMPTACKLRNLLQSYDIVQAYGTDPIYAMLLSAGRPYIAFEHGTMRDLPFENSPTGRLLAVAYRHAAKVIITNPDVIGSARRLGLDQYVFVPHPIDENGGAASQTTLPLELRAQHPNTLVILAPARQNWKIKGSDRPFYAFRDLLKSGRRAILYAARWGQEVERSEHLIRNLGISDHVMWFKPVHRKRLLQYYQACDVVLDQFVLGSFGGIAPQAMACGKPVIMHYDTGIQRWAFPEPPPLMQAQSASEIFHAMISLYDDADLRSKLADDGVEWVRKHHGWRVVVERQLSLYGEVVAEMRRPYLRAPGTRP